MGSFIKRWFLTAIAAITIVMGASLTAYAGEAYGPGYKSEPAHSAFDCELMNRYLKDIDSYARLDLVGKAPKSGGGHIGELGEEINGTHMTTFTWPDGRIEDVCVRGSLFADENAQLHALLPDGSLAVDGEYEGYLWDETGRMISAFDYTFVKYRPDWYSKCPTITFENQIELANFTVLMQVVMADSQDLKFTAYIEDDGRITVNKETVYKALHHTSETDDLMNKMVDEIVEGVNRECYDLSNDKAVIISAMAFIGDKLQYDNKSVYDSMAKSLTEGKGVCYHYNKLAMAVLDRLGFENRFVLGRLDGKSHCWLMVKSRTDDRWITVDPSLVQVVTPFMYMTDYVPDKAITSVGEKSPALLFNK